jgi:cytochrome c oxidase subunit 2
MRAKLKGMRKLAAGIGAGMLASSLAMSAWAGDTLGQPTAGAIDFQPAASVLKHQVIFFHNLILLPITVGICLLVLGLLAWVAIRYNKKANPVPANWSHNTVIEVLWTIVPVLILVGIAVPSFSLLFQYHDMPKPYMTVKATGYQWYWGYEYPDQKVPEITSLVLPEDQAKAKGVPYLLAATTPMVVPVNKVVRVQVTAVDVIHSFGLPAFGLKTDAIPGRLNETWFRAEKVGTYYGQCSELCGVDHAFMPIEIKVVSQADFDAWVATKAAPAAPTQTATAAPAAGAAPAAIAAPASTTPPAAAPAAAAAKL